MIWLDLTLASAVSIFAGLDRTALLQMMVCRPIVAAPLTGCLLGDAAAGLQIGAMLELLWIGRLPVGAAIPPDDTQIAIGATTLAGCLGPVWGYGGPTFALLALLVAMPLGRLGQVADRWARDRNGWLQKEVETAIEEGKDLIVERCHLMGLVHFGLASLVTFLLIVGLGALVLKPLAPYALPLMDPVGRWLELAFPVVGAGIIISTVNISRSLTLFSASFVTALLMLWLT